ncbi:RNA helicase [Bifidobacterium callitrichos]|uniref:RNA helicase n=1 Tax=Bifidobacterium callitrichos TaxID=762209 RepID=A0A2T3G839_9BIFI|nr:DUF3427 domain-containing protein [Bifidobacterium callitrichos]PST45657.1 RNA helicase [Bifidobacterium callitrichos]
MSDQDTHAFGLDSAGERTVLEDVVYGLIDPNTQSSGAYAPMLITNGPDGRTMSDALHEEIADSDCFDISVAFVKTEAMRGLLQDFMDHHDASDETSRLITSTKNYFNSPQDFRALLHLGSLSGIDVRVWEGSDRDGDASESSITQGQPFHPKGYVFRRRMPDGRPYYNLYVGSSNLTTAALSRQREWNLRLSSLADGGLVNQFRQEIDTQISESVPLTEEWIKRYEEDFRRYAPPRRELLRDYDKRTITPNAMQREALRNLKELREQGEHRAIIVSATGTGKTYLSAFDVREYQPRRMLYIAQQQQILTKAMQSYRKVLGCDESELGLYSGTSKQQDRRYVFATIQTMSQSDVLAQFASDEFDYILVDEVHHAGAKRYRQLIDHFKDAGFMLGMTATPERTDGINIFELFGHNIAYEIRLQRALDEGMLCPFHYYGIAEYLGSQEDPDHGDDHPRIEVSDEISAEDDAQLQYEISQLATEGRVRYIIDKLEQYGQPGLPVTGLVFCSRQEEAHELSRLFNRHMNQQAERPYRTVAVTSKDEQGRKVSDQERERYVKQLEDGDLDYLFTVDMFNEGIDIPALNQVVMLRNTESSIVFTQQLGRGLRKFPHKDSVTVIDFIGNYRNNYLIPVALYGNTGDRDIARRNLQRRSIGLSSISFDPIAKERILGSLDTADWSDMKRLTEQYRQIRFELGRIPMLTDVYRYDPSLPSTLASKRGNYLDFVRSREQSLSRGGQHDTSYLDQLEPVGETENAVLKMATELLLPGLRPHELVILSRLCGFAYDLEQESSSDALQKDALQKMDQSVWHAPMPMGRDDLLAAIRHDFPQADASDSQFDSAISVLDYSYFREGNRKRFGDLPLIASERHAGNGTTYRLSDRFATMLTSNRTFRTFLRDTLQVGLSNCRDLFQDAREHHRTFDHAFLYERKYSLDDVMRLCGWKKENTPQNVGGYYLDKESGTMPIFVKYATSQYEDEFLSAQEMRYFSKNGRTPQSPEFRWLRENTGPEWDDTHFVPLFVMRKAEAETPDGKKLKGSKYYYVGHVAAVEHPELTTKPDASGNGTVKVTLSTLRLAKPIDPELYRHLIG